MNNLVASSDRHLAPDAAAAAHAALLEAVASPVRLRLLACLAEGPCCVGELVERGEALQPAVSRHLAVLREVGLVEAEVDGRRRCYRLTRPEWVGELFRLLRAFHAPAPE